SVTFTAGTFTLSFYAAQRGNYHPDNDQVIEVRVDGNLVGTFTPASTGYQLLTTDSFTVTAGSHTITFNGLATGDSTAFIDQVSVQAVSNLTYSTDPDIGLQNVNFYRTLYDYDDRGRLHRTETPTATIYRTEFDGIGRVVSTWVGTD